MWPPVKRENNIGTSLDKNFWNEWGPTHIYYFNPDIFNDSRKIKCIFFTYEPYNQVSFLEDEIAMGIHYECGEFGQHIGLFSYVDIPTIKHGEHWDYYVYPNISSDLPDEIYLNKISMIYGHDNLYELFLGYKIIDKYVLVLENYNKLKLCLMNMLEDKSDNNYIKFLEVVALHGDAVELLKKRKWSEQFLETQDEKQRIKLISNVLNNDVLLDKNYIKRQYNNAYNGLFNERENNDLNQIFINCRDTLIEAQSVVQHEKALFKNSDDFDDLLSDENLSPIYNIEDVYGTLEKVSNNKPVFVKRKEYGICRKEDDNEWK